MKGTPWDKIKTEYITTETSYKKLCAKYGVSMRTLGDRARSEKWVDARIQQREKTVSKMIAAESKKQVERYSRIQNLTDRLMDKIEQSINELDMHIAKSTHRQKTIEYNNYDRPDKPTKEIVDEIEEVTAYQSIIDKNGLKQIASALRDLKEVQMIRSDLDRREQEARIANLEKQISKDATDNVITVRMEGIDEDWCR